MAVASLINIILDFITTEIRDFNEQCWNRTTSNGDEVIFCNSCMNFCSKPEQYCIYCPSGTIKRNLINLWIQWLSEAGTNVKVKFFKMLARRENYVCKVVYHINPRRCTRYCSRCFTTYRLLRSWTTWHKCLFIENESFLAQMIFRHLNHCNGTLLEDISNQLDLKFEKLYNDLFKLFFVL